MTTDRIETEFGTIGITYSNAIPQDTVLVVSRCDCGHGAIAHDDNGCTATLRYQYPPEGTANLIPIQCACQTPVSRLISATRFNPEEARK